MKSELAALPAQYGFASAADFAAAVTKAAGKPRGRKPGNATAAVKPAVAVVVEPAAAVAGKHVAAAKPKAPAKKKRRKRAVITDATKAEVKKLVEAGKSGGEIAKAVGISLPSVQNVKKALGLVKKTR